VSQPQQFDLLVGMGKRWEGHVRKAEEIAAERPPEAPAERKARLTRQLDTAEGMFDDAHGKDQPDNGASDAARAWKKHLMLTISAHLAKQFSPDELQEFDDWFKAEARGHPRNTAQSVASRIVTSWSESSCDHRQASIAVQAAARRVFGLDDSKLTQDELDVLNAKRPRYGETPVPKVVERILDAAVRFQYDATQKYLKDRGIEEVVLFRGTGSPRSLKRQPSQQELDEGTWETIDSHPLSSWSSQIEQARQFTRSDGVMMTMVVPRERIYAIPMTGSGCLREHEFIVLGGQDRARAQTTDEFMRKDTAEHVALAAAGESSVKKLAADPDAWFIDEPPWDDWLKSIGRDVDAPTQELLELGSDPFAEAVHLRVGMGMRWADHVKTEEDQRRHPADAFATRDFTFTALGPHRRFLMNPTTGHVVFGGQDHFVTHAEILDEAQQRDRTLPREYDDYIKGSVDAEGGFITLMQLYNHPHWDRAQAFDHAMSVLAAFVRGGAGRNVKVSGVEMGRSVSLGEEYAFLFKKPKPVHLAVGMGQRWQGHAQVRIHDTVEVRGSEDRPYFIISGWIGTSLVDFGELTTERRGQFLRVEQVGVREAFRRQGIGRRLYEAALERARELGLKGLISSPTGRNANSEELWNSFRREGRVTTVDLPGGVNKTYTWDFLPVPVDPAPIHLAVGMGLRWAGHDMVAPDAAAPSHAPTEADRERVSVKLATVPRSEGIQAAEEAWAGGVADFGDPEAATLVQRMPGYATYQRAVQRVVESVLGKQFTVYRAMTPDAYDDFKAGAQSGPLAVSLNPSMAASWRKFAPNQGKDLVIVEFPVTPQMVVMAGKSEEDELVIDSDWVSFDTLTPRTDLSVALDLAVGMGQRWAGHTPKERVEILHIDYAYGENIYVARVKDANDKIVGQLDYSIYRDEIVVKNVEVDPEVRRQGVATALYDAVREANPGLPLTTMGFQTPEGAAFRAAYDATRNTQGVTGTPEFTQWFGASKVVDERGRPLKLYHGGADVVEFKTPLFLSPYRHVAESYRDERTHGEAVQELYARIERPARNADVVAAAQQAGVTDHDKYPEMDFQWLSPGIVGKEVVEKVIAQLQKQGFDGAWISGDFSMDDPFTEYDSLVVFDTAQVKRTSNTTFDPTSPRVDLAVGMGMRWAGHAKAEAAEVLRPEEVRQLARLTKVDERGANTGLATSRSRKEADARVVAELSGTLPSERFEATLDAMRTDKFPYAKPNSRLGAVQQTLAELSWAWLTGAHDLSAAGAHMRYPEVAALRKAAQDEFRLTAPTMAPNWDPSPEDQRKAAILQQPQHQEVFRAILRATYNETQRQLAEAGLDHVTIFRGTSTMKMAAEDQPLPEPNDGRWLPVNPGAVTSWSVTTSGAAKFASEHHSGKLGVLWAVRVPRERILSIPTAGVGSWHEDEVLLLGGAKLPAFAYRTEFWSISADEVAEAAAKRRLSADPFADAIHLTVGMGQRWEGHVPAAEAQIAEMKATNAAVRNYTAEYPPDPALGYVAINRQLRRGIGLTDEQAEAVALIDKAMKPLPQRMLLWHGVTVASKHTLEVVTTTPVGETFVDNAFMSTSRSRDIAVGWAAYRSVLVEIDAPRGTPSLDPDDFVYSRGEQETILGRGLTYRVISREDTELTTNTSKIPTAVTLVRLRVELKDASFSGQMPDRKDLTVGMGQRWAGHVPAPVIGEDPSSSEMAEQLAAIAKDMEEGQKTGLPIYGVLGMPDMLDVRQVHVYLREAATRHEAQPLPAEYERGEPKECYRNATLLMMRNPKLRFAEGIAYAEFGLPYLHAWCVDPDGKVVDPTWAHPEKCTYTGVIYDRQQYLAHVMKTKVYGVLGGREKDAMKVITRGGLR
jgi:GNAT superfamily N-acetyltransferase